MISRSMGDDGDSVIVIFNLMKESSILLCINVINNVIAKMCKNMTYAINTMNGSGNDDVVV